MALPALAATALGTVFAHVLAALVFKIITAFGIGFVVFFGVGTLIEGAFTEIENAMSGLPVEVVKVFITLRIDDAISVLSSAVSIRLSFKTFGLGGDIRKLQVGLPEATP